MACLLLGRNANMKLVRLIHRLGLAGIVAALAACGVGVSFDEYNPLPPNDAGTGTDALDSSDSPDASADGSRVDGDASLPDAGPPVLYGVSGSVMGLDGAKLRLGLGVKEIEVGDGPFTFPPALITGAPFEVDILAQPAGRVCHTENATGVIASAEATGVVVTCVPAFAEITSVCFLDPGGPGVPNACALYGEPVFPAFSPNVHEYTVVMSSNHNVITAQAVAAQPGSTIKMTGPSLPGIENGYFYPNRGPNSVTMDVTAPDGVTHGVYEFNVIIDPIHYIKPSDNHAGASFGAAVALEGATLVVGAPGTGSDSGAVYVFQRSLTSTGYVWSQTAMIKPSPAEAGARFGSSVQLSGTTVVVAANESSSGAGAVYAFELTNGAWTNVASLTAPAPSPGAHFGASISLFGNTLAVGAPGEVSETGAAYVFTHSGGAWSSAVTIKASNARAGAKFGTGVAVNGDRLAVGAPGDSSIGRGVDADQTPGGASNSGAVYAFRRAGTSWSQDLFAKLQIFAQPGESDLLGSSIAVTKDAVFASFPGQDAVEAFAFYGVGTGWRDHNGYPVSHAATGHATAVICPVLDYGGTRYLLTIGSPLEAGGGLVTLAGETVIPYNLAKPAESFSAQLRAPNARPNALFGAAMAFTGDFVGSTLAVGSPGESSKTTTIDGDASDTSAPLAGAVYVF